jgi:hypothetical protein
VYFAGKNFCLPVKLLINAPGVYKNKFSIPPAPTGDLAFIRDPAFNGSFTVARSSIIPLRKMKMNSWEGHCSHASRIIATLIE